MTNMNNHVDQATQLYRTNTNSAHAEQQRSFQNSMVVMWDAMTRLFHPQWTKNNGEIGGPVFRDWTTELIPMGSRGVLHGLSEIRAAGSSYAPNLNKFMAACRGNADNYIPGESFSETLHGGKIKPTPCGVPLCWTIGTYTVDELESSRTNEDAECAQQLRMSCQTHITIELQS